MKKLYATFIAVFTITQFSYAQWVGSPGNINYTTGNVSIGTTSSTAKLDVRAAVTSGNSVSLQSWSWTDDEHWGLKLNQYHSGSSIDQRFVQNNGGVLTNILTLRLGNIGIGTTNPDNKLHVIGNIRTDGGNMSIGNNRPTLTITDTEQGSDLKNWDIHTALGVINFRLANDIYNAANNWMTVKRSGYVPSSVSFPNGNVGIGTENPISALQIVRGGTNPNTDYSSLNIATYGTGNIFGPIIYLDAKSGTGGRQWGLVSSGALDAAATGATGNFAIYDAGAGARLVINADGNVGIGTVNPEAPYKLSVNGKIRSKEIKVEAGWSDYVFNDDYKLKTIPEVENYIKQNHHLPDVPSAAEVEKNGVALGETSSLLLKKIEELTLYLIEKDKQMKVMQAQIDALKKQVNKANSLK